MAFWQNFKEQLGGTWSAVDAGTKVITIVVGLVLLASVAVAIYFNRKPQNTLLYGQLSQ